MLTPPTSARAKEKILAFGLYGSGKSYAWATIADVYRKTSTPGHFHIVSTEWERAQRTAEGFPDFDTNCTIYETDGWESLKDTTGKVRDNATSDDWLILDSIGLAQSWVRDVYFGDRFGMSFRDWQTLGHKMNEIKPNEWNLMDGWYRSWFGADILRFPGHRYATAQADRLSTGEGWTESRQIRHLYERLGTKPVGHKELGYMFDTVLLFSNPSKGEWELTTAKPEANGRESLENEPIAAPPLGFVQTYLVATAGWTL